MKAKQYAVAVLLALVLIFVLLILQPVLAAGTFVGDMTPTTTAKVVGHGCTTAYFIDADCDGCGIGVYSSGSFTAVTTATPGNYPTGYQTVKNPVAQGAPPFYSVSDTIDADDQDSSVCTTTDWQNKWIGIAPFSTDGQCVVSFASCTIKQQNQAIINFLSVRKGFTNSSRIFYLSLNGQDSSGVQNDPTHPYFTFGKTQATLSDFQGGAIIIRGATLTGAGTVAAQNTAVNCTATPGVTGCTLTSAWSGPSSSIASGGVGFTLGLTATTSTGQVLRQVLIKPGSTAVSWSNAGTITGGPTTTITVNYGILTVTTPPSPTNLSPGQRLLMAGVPAPTYLIADDGGTGGNGNYYVGDPELTITSVGSTTSFATNWGVSLNFNTGVYNFGNPGSNPAGSSGKPLYIMNYPGEVVETDVGWLPTSSSAPGRNSQGWLTFDGFKFWDYAFGFGNAMVFTYGSNLSVINTEFSGFYHIETGANAKTLLFQHDVFHDMFDHSIYVSIIAGCETAFNNETLASGDFDFNLDAVNQANGTSCGAIKNARIMDSDFYDGGQIGYDPLHLNAWEIAAVVSGNILTFHGGIPISLQTGCYNCRVTGNLAYDNASYCFQEWVYGVSGPTIAGTNRWNEFSHDLCWTSAPTDSIQGKSPAGGIYFAVCTTTTGGSCNQVTKPAWVKDTYVANDVWVTSDSTSSTGSAAWTFGSLTYPDQNIFDNNIIFSIGTQLGGRTIVQTNASPSVPTGNYSCGGTAPTCTFTTVNANWTGNQYLNPNFPSASESLISNPGQFDFGVYNLH